MKPLWIGLIGLVSAAMLWLAGGLPPVEAEYQVAVAPDGKATLTMVVARPGLFLDLLVPQGSTIAAAAVGGKPASLLTPWPGARRRVAAFWRGPVQLTLAEGAGPFQVTNLPEPVAGPAPAFSLPAGWIQVGEYVGRLTLVQAEPVAVAVPVGSTYGQQMAEQVNELYTAAGHLVTLPPARPPVVVLSSPEPEAAARAVVDLWLPDYDAEAAWWQKGAAEYYTKRLLDQTKLWDNEAERQYLKDKNKSQEFLLVVWLDMSMKYGSNRDRSVDDLLRRAVNVRTNADLLTVVQEVAGRGVADKLERMLNGREPLPSVKL